VSATQTPPEQPQPSPGPDAPPERHCRRCGATLGPEQEWCLACGAAARTDVARPRGWRLPLVLAAAVVVLAIAAAILAIAELSNGPARVAEAPTATPSPTPTVGASPTPFPTTGAPENEGDQPPAGTTVTPTPTQPAAGGAIAPGATPSATPSVSPGATPTGTSTFPDWPAGRSAWTIVLKSAASKSAAESAARNLQSAGDTVGILHSDDHSSLKPGFWVVFSGQYDSQKAAENGMSSLPSKPADAYVRRVSAT
jgi:predicted nucleic acid-binding Zn ribbon protein